MHGREANVQLPLSKSATAKPVQAIVAQWAWGGAKPAMSRSNTIAVGCSLPGSGESASRRAAIYRQRAIPAGSPASAKAPMHRCARQYRWVHWHPAKIGMLCRSVQSGRDNFAADVVDIVQDSTGDVAKVGFKGKDGKNLVAPIDEDCSSDGHSQAPLNYDSHHRL